MLQQPILLVDDDPADVLLIRRTLEIARVTNPVLPFSYPQNALRYLEAAMRAPKRTLMPFAILVDMHMPGLDGFGLLEWIRGQSALASVPVLVVSGSNDPAVFRKVTHHSGARFVAKESSCEALLSALADVKSELEFADA